MALYNNEQDVTKSNPTRYFIVMIDPGMQLIGQNNHPEHYCLEARHHNVTIAVPHCINILSSRMIRHADFIASISACAHMLRLLLQ